VLRLRAEGVRLSVALVFDISAGADVVLARPPIRELNQIKASASALSKARWAR